MKYTLDVSAAMLRRSERTVLWLCAGLGISLGFNIVVILWYHL